MYTQYESMRYICKVSLLHSALYIYIYYMQRVLYYIVVYMQSVLIMYTAIYAKCPSYPVLYMQSVLIIKWHAIRRYHGISPGSPLHYHHVDC